MTSKLTQVSLLAGRAADYIKDGDKKAYTEIEKQCEERFPEYYPGMFQTLVQADLKPLDQVGEQDPYQFNI